MKTSHRGIALIKRFEGFRGVAYLCPAGVPTIGWGTTAGVTMDDVRNKRSITREQAEQMLMGYLTQYEDAVYRALGGYCNQHEFDACVSLAYNIGIGGFYGSTVAKAHRRGDKLAACRAFCLWNRATVNGQRRVVAGLTARRAAEAALYAEPVARSVVDEPEPMPQAVEPERPMTASTINRASVAAGTTATLAAAGEALQAVQGVRQGLHGLEGWIVPGLLVVVVALCGYIVWERVKQRTGGWA
jgi:lysozyme